MNQYCREGKVPKMQLTFFSFITDMNEPAGTIDFNYNENGFKIDYMKIPTGCRIPLDPAICDTILC